MATTEASTEATTQGYQLEGSLLEVCNCDTLCPCWIGDDPDNGFCQSVVAYNLDKGTITGIDVSGLTLIGVVHIPGNILEGNWKQAVLVDDRATDEQMDAMLQCFGGALGGPLADLASLIGERVSIERAKIEHYDQGRRGNAEGRGQDRLHDAALSRARRQHHDAQQLDLLDRAGLAGVRREGRPPEGRRRPRSASGSSRARTPSSPTGRSTTAASDESAPRPILVGISRRLGRRDRRPGGAALPRSRTTTRCSTRRRPALRASRPLIAPARLAGDDRRDDAAVEPAAGAAVSRATERSAAAGAARWPRSSAATR